MFSLSQLPTRSCIGTLTIEDGSRVSSRFHVAVVGGGPAGAAAAIWSARQGLETVLFEAQCFPRDRPGETLHPGIEPLFLQLKVLEPILEAGFMRYGGHWVSWAGPLHFQDFGSDRGKSRLGFQAWRADLDSILIAEAKRAGAHIMQPCRAVALTIESDRVVGLHTSAGHIRTRFVIDASGARHWLQRSAGMRMRRASRRLVAMYGYARTNNPPDDHLPLIVGSPEGWTWVAQVRSELIAWTRLDFRKLRNSPPDCVSNLQLTVPLRGADVTWRVLEECAGKGYFVAGDAAAVLDPASSHGVLRAIMSGIFAAELASKVSGGKITEPEAIFNFRKWMLAWFENDRVRLSGLYQSLRPAVAVCI